MSRFTPVTSTLVGWRRVAQLGQRADSVCVTIEDVDVGHGPASAAILGAVSVVANPTGGVAGKPAILHRESASAREPPPNGPAGGRGAYRSGGARPKSIHMGRSAAAHRRASVLVGTSDAAIERGARNAFGGGGFAVTTAATDAEVLAAFARGRPSLVLLAFEHMDADGFSLCGELDRMHRDDPVPVIVFVDELDGNAIASAYRAGAVDVVVRPVEWTLIVQRAPRLLQMADLASELGRTRASLESVQRIAGVGSWVWDVETQQMQWSDQMYAILGFEPGGVKTDFEHFALSMHPEDRDVAIDVLKEAVIASRSFAVPLRVVLGSGSVRYVQLQGEISAEDVFQVRGTMQDVTEQRRAQEKIRNLAHYDSLTGLANRRLFMEQLERDHAERPSRPRHHGAALPRPRPLQRTSTTPWATPPATSCFEPSAASWSDGCAPPTPASASRPTSARVRDLAPGGDEFAVLAHQVSRRGSSRTAGRVACRILDALSVSIQWIARRSSRRRASASPLYPEDGRTSRRSSSTPTGRCTTPRSGGETTTSTSRRR